MQINLSNDQYRDLIKMVFLGNLMINSIRDDDKRLKKYDEVEQSLYQYAREAGMDKLLIYLPDQNRYGLGKEFMDTSDIKAITAEFVGDVFWGELINRMASRDTMNKYGSDLLKKGTLEEFTAKQEPYLKKYRQEFLQNGLDNLEVK